MTVGSLREKFKTEADFDALAAELVPLSMVEKARRIAEIVFDGENDPAGDPYFKHCAFVANGPEFTNVMKAVGWLHDVPEDAGKFGWTVARLNKLGIPKNVTDVVAKMTRPKGAEYFDHLEMHADDPIYCAVKWRDLSHNRQARVPEEKKAKMNPVQLAKLEHKWNFVYPLAQAYLAEYGVQLGVRRKAVPITAFMDNNRDTLGCLADMSKLVVMLPGEKKPKYYSSHVKPSDGPAQRSGLGC